ncbi:ABC transporter ATP-binding protein [Paraburkholderia caledonica]|uniref:Spermidine/putrescine transport system ATP-binding protein n=1 Tax=Paraburkholderia caledonica TaxID=134536 RepID=A0AB73INQ5_9BURK|nr:putative spermidine/putrescine transport system ATP-binding protein [Paraburkholderia caledonica]
MSVLLDVRGLSKRYGSTAALHPVSFSIESSEFVAVLGASGCGKSTLLGLLMGIIAQDDGEIVLNGKRIDALPPERRDLAMVFQSYALFSHMTVRSNLSFGLRMKKMSPDERARRINRAVRMCGLHDHLHRFPDELSGGQQQRVALARALVMKAPLTLYDEPLSNLDAKLRDTLRSEIVALHRATGAAALYVTHDPADAATMADCVIVMDEGRIVETGTPHALYRTPALRITAELFGAGNVIDVPVENGMGILGPTLRLRLVERASRVPAARATVVVPAEGIRLTPRSDGEGVVVGSRVAGPLVHYEVSVGNRVLRATVFGTRDVLPWGTPVALAVNDPLHWLDEQPVRGAGA